MTTRAAPAGADITVSPIAESARRREVPAGRGSPHARSSRADPAGDRAMFSFQRVTGADVAGLTRELSVLVEAKIPLARGLMSIAEQETKPGLRRIIADVAMQIEAGATMTEALSRHKDVFGEVYIETMRAAEKSGNLSGVTTELADLLDRQMDLRRQLRQAMTYPVVVLCTVAVAFGVFVGFVIPRFAGQFKTGGVELPLATRVVQAFGESVRGEWWMYLIGLASVVMSVVTAWRTEQGRIAIERFVMRTPVVGSLAVAAVTARFLRIMSLTVSSGLGLVESVVISGRAAGGKAFASDCRQVSDRLTRGESLGDALSSAPHLPVFAKRMLGAGTDSADLSRASLLVARHFDRRASDLTKSVSSLIEPVMTVLMAGLVLLVALSVFLPMWQLARIGR
ncbi:MAG: type II secretion system F family protein [Phycisphaeraceae bacterium]|nr:type II secretion system F family protein [Phycisphaerae bacterium]MBX3391656.1 type II secretion system F family protein [Phycisphaeraceae bacterium]